MQTPWKLVVTGTNGAIWEAAMTTEEIVECLSGHLDEMRRRFAVEKLALFGSVARGRMSETSDVDVLVVFQGTPTFNAFMDLKFYLEDLLHRPVDLVTDKALRPQIRRAIEGERIDVA